MKTNIEYVMNEQDDNPLHVLNLDGTTKHSSTKSRCVSSVVNDRTFGSTNDQKKGVISKKKNIGQKTKLQKDNFSFNYDKFVAKAVCVLLLVLVFEGAVFVRKISFLASLDNQTRLATTNCRNWANMRSLNLAVMDTLIWNNTVQVFGTPSATAVHSITQDQRTSVLPALRQAAGQNLGTFTAFYNQYMVKEDPCGQVVFQTAPEQ